MTRRAAKMATAQAARARAAQDAGRCPTGKLPYPSRATAGKALRARRRRSGPGDDELTTYRCRHPECGRWHIGHDDIGRPP